MMNILVAIPPTLLKGAKLAIIGRDVEDAVPYIQS